MTRRFVDHGIRILAAVALWLAVISSPILSSGAFHSAPPPNFLPRKFAILKIGHSGQFAMSARPSLREADSLQSDIEDELDLGIEDELTVTSPPFEADHFERIVCLGIEDELTVTSPPASVSYDVLPPPSPKPYSELVSFADALAARPLRC